MSCDGRVVLHKDGVVPRKRGVVLCKGGVVLHEDGVVHKNKLSN